VRVNNELERMWKESFMAYFKILPQNLSGGTEENHEKPVGIVGVPAKTQTEHLLNASQRHYHFSQLAW
jgi:hypothetical protein